MKITDILYSFLVSKKTEDLTWFYKACKEPAKKAVIKDKCIDDRYKQYTKKITEKLRTLEVNVQRKADTIDMEKLQRGIEDVKKSIRKLWDYDKEDKNGQL